MEGKHVVNCPFFDQDTVFEHKSQVLMSWNHRSSFISSSMFDNSLNVKFNIWILLPYSQKLNIFLIIFASDADF